MVPVSKVALSGALAASGTASQHKRSSIIIDHVMLQLIEYLLPTNKVPVAHFLELFV